MKSRQRDFSTHRTNKKRRLLVLWVHTSLPFDHTRWSPRCNYATDEMFRSFARMYQKYSQLKFRWEEHTPRTVHTLIAIMRYAWHTYGGAEYPLPRPSRRVTKTLLFGAHFWCFHKLNEKLIRRNDVRSNVTANDVISGNTMGCDLVSFPTRAIGHTRNFQKLFTHRTLNQWDLFLDIWLNKN